MDLRTNLKAVIEQSDTRLGKAFDWSVQALIVFSLITFSLETMPGLSVEHRKWLRFLELSCVTIFAFEYMARLIVADKKKEFVFSWYGFFDLVAILPAFWGLDMRSARIFRLLRLFRLAKFARYSKAMQRYSVAIQLAREELVLYSLFTIFVLFFAASGIHIFESDAQPEQFGSVFQCLWWSVVTFTTVGYGDVYPITVGGKIFTALVLFAGLGIVAVPAGIFAAALREARSREDQHK